jgi:hypothetical protein
MRVVLFVVLALASQTLLAQVQMVEKRVETYKAEKRLNLRFGGGISYQSGPSNVAPEFDQKYITPFGEGFFGYRFDIGNNYSSNFVGLFGRFGTLNKEAIKNLNDLGAIAYANTNNSGAWVYEVEGGMIFDDWFRLSAGVGQTKVRLNNGQRDNINYYIATTGLNLRFSTFNLFTNFGAQFGTDFKKAALRGGVGLMVDFRFLSMKVK